jgi:hypothetical protein
MSADRSRALSLRERARSNSKKKKSFRNTISLREGESKTEVTEVLGVSQQEAGKMADEEAAGDAKPVKKKPLGAYLREQKQDGEGGEGGEGEEGGAKAKGKSKKKKRRGSKPPAPPRRPTDLQRTASVPGAASRLDGVMENDYEESDSDDDEDVEVCVGPRGPEQYELIDNNRFRETLAGEEEAGLRSPSGKKLEPQATAKSLLYVDRSGFLVKSGKNGKSFKRRWFVLNHDKLEYYGTCLSPSAHFVYTHFQCVLLGSRQKVEQA